MPFQKNGWLPLLALQMLLLLGSASAQRDSAITVTEVMFNTATANAEFIELFNLSSTDTVDLRGYFIRYASASPDTILSAGFGTKLPPRRYAVILEGDYAVPGIYDSLIPTGAVRLKISSNAFGSNGMANTEDRVVAILRRDSSILEAYTYSANNQSGFSDEKILLLKSNMPSNWGNSRSRNGTPGAQSSIAPREYDLSVLRIRFQPVDPLPADQVRLWAYIRNSGTLLTSPCSLAVYYDANADSLPQPTEMLGYTDIQVLQPGDSVEAYYYIGGYLAGRHRFIARVVSSQDQDSSNNIGTGVLTVRQLPYEYHAMVVNEIMYAPLTAAGESEWVELKNPGTTTVNLKKWKLGSGGAFTVIASSDLFLPPGGYIVLAKDSSAARLYPNQAVLKIISSLSLNNNGDEVVLKDSTGTLIDSVAYLPVWGGQLSARSLERKQVAGSNEPSNWGESVSRYRATPGKLNSIAPRAVDPELRSLVIQPDFPAPGTEILLRAAVANRGTSSTGNVFVSFYYDANADSLPGVDELLYTSSGVVLPVGDSSAFTYTYPSVQPGTSRFIARIVTTLDEEPDNNTAFASVVARGEVGFGAQLVINEIMYAPKTGSAEWIEIFNRSDAPVSIANLRFADARDTVTVSRNRLSVDPGSYLVIASDSSIFRDFGFTAPFLIMPGMPQLNNEGDRCMLMDSLNRMYDSLVYLGSWGEYARSLERVNAALPGTAAANWKPALSRTGGTPGMVNSVSAKLHDPAVTGVLFTPAYPWYGDTVTIAASVKNYGSVSASCFLRLWYDVNNDSLPDQLLEFSPQTEILPGDSVLYRFSYPFRNITTIRTVLVELKAVQDEDTLNNVVIAAVSPGVPPGAIVVTEFMNNPAVGGTEWVELFNASSREVSLNGWRISDVLSAPSSFMLHGVTLQPGGYLILAADSAIFSAHGYIPAKVAIVPLPVLNNDSDGIVVKDERGLSIDSVFYTPAWGSSRGISFERKSASAPGELPRSFTFSVDLLGCTPGRINSIWQKVVDLAPRSLATRPDFPVPYSSFRPGVTVYNFGSNASPEGTMLISFNNGYQSSDLPVLAVPSVPAADSITIYSPEFIPVRDAPVTVTAAISVIADGDSGNNTIRRVVLPGQAPKAVVFNEVLINPYAAHSAWIELLNNSDTLLSLAGWSISFAGGSPVRIDSAPHALQKDSFFIVAFDTLFRFSYPSCTAAVGTAAAINPGKTSGVLLLLDHRGAVIDTFLYNQNWEMKRGISLERISGDYASTLPANWLSSVAAAGATPGSPNTTLPGPVNGGNVLRLSEIMYDPGDSESEYIEIANISGSVVDLGGYAILLNGGRKLWLSDSSLLLAPGGLYVLCSDSSLFLKFGYTPLCNRVYGTDLGLPAAGAGLTVTDRWGRILESFSYTPAMHNHGLPVTRGRSLERVSLTLPAEAFGNWTSSAAAAGGTPGKNNSVFAPNTTTAGGSIRVAPNPFSPDNDGFEDFAVISVDLPFSAGLISVSVYDAKGYRVRIIEGLQVTGPRFECVFNGIDDHGSRLPLGIYVVLLEAVPAEGGTPVVLKKAIVSARKLR